MITLQEVKEYLRIDIDEDDQLLQTLITAAVEYLKNATGKEYPATDEEGNAINYEIEKIYLKLLLAHWYENRTPAGNGKGTYAGGVVEDFSFIAKSLMLQLQNK